MRNEMPIGFFDSGLGGIGLLAHSVKALPNERFIYYGDSANAPYGTKSAEKVRSLTMDAASLMVNEGIKALVVACNTASGAAAAKLREIYDFPIIALEPALKVAEEHHLSGIIPVLATPLTLASVQYAKLHEKYGTHAVSLPCPGLMEFVEREELDSNDLYRYLKELFKPFEGSEIDAVVLGCTHYLFIRGAIQKSLPESVRIIDSNEGVTRQLQRKLEEYGLLRSDAATGGISIHSSGGPEKENQMLRMLRLISSR
jgi:glutamate racemase